MSLLSRERNRIHAQRSRLRKKFYIKGLQTDVEKFRQQKAALIAAIKVYFSLPLDLR
jgi:hypothetical protein